MAGKVKFILRFIFISVLGVLLHFTYQWSGENFIVGLFSATNESTWEHLKLIFFPMLLLTIWELLCGKEKEEDFLQSRTIGILWGMSTIVILFYTLWGIFGNIYDWLNIVIYLFGVFIALYTEEKLSKTNPSISKATCVIVLTYLTLAFFLLTYNAPDVGIFYDLSQHPR